MRLDTEDPSRHAPSNRLPPTPVASYFRWAIHFENAMRHFVLSIAASLVLTTAAGLAAMQSTPPGQSADDIVKSDPDAAAQLEARLLGPAFQVTLDGARAGEGYLSADGRWMTFQSERTPGNPFFQIYLMNLDNGLVERISPGHGKTTCSWIHPDMNRILFASTHEDPDALAKQKSLIEQRAAGNAPKYAWDYDEHFEIYAYDRAHKSYQNLTNAVGYDAEGSYSPDGQWIAFSSNRRAYDGSMTAEEKEKSAVDPAFMADLYLMKSDGSDVRRLTDAPGYDGGPFFSPDGKQICWRHFSTPEMAEIMVMNADGSNPRQLTRLNALSWAPFFHPSGKYLVFGTNKHGFDNFELYLVSAQGGEPVRVTYTAGFDSLPAFSPGGDRLYWTSTRGNKGGQIFTARWDHSAALRALGLDDASDIARHVAYLCRPELEGRLTGSEGEKKAADYVASTMDQIGLKPAAPNGTWFHEFTFLAGAKLGSNNRLTSEQSGSAEDFSIDQSWRPLSFSKSGAIESAPVVFAGYGIVAPKSDRFPAHDAFAQLDVKDKWVLAFRFVPENITPELRQHLASSSSLRDKARAARDLGAKGLLVVSGPTSRVRDQLVPLQRDSALSGTSIAVISVSDDVARKWLKAADKDLNELQTKLDSGEPLTGFVIPDLKVSADIDVQQVTDTSRNVLGRLQVGPQPSEQVIVVGAHVDHLGRGTSSSLARENEKGEIHFGADDNASGVGTMLEVAEELVEQVRQNPAGWRRDIVFAAWSGEELGLHGSRALVADLQSMIGSHASASSSATSTSVKADPNNPHAEPPKPSIYPHIAAYLNMDMVGRFDKVLILQGIGSSPDWTAEIERLHIAANLPITLQSDTNLPTDATSFYQAGVPILAAFTGTHGDYHSPRDTPDKLNYERAAQIADFMGKMAEFWSKSETVPGYIEHKVEAAPAQARMGTRAYLGAPPDYAAEVVGAQVSVTPGSPADKAGMKANDVIVELAGRKIENVQDFAAAISALKIGEKAKIVVLRAGQRLELEVVPGSRQ